MELGKVPSSTEKGKDRKKPKEGESHSLDLTKPFGFTVTKVCPLGPIQQTCMCVGHIWTRLTMKRRYIPCNMVVNADLLFVLIA